jgi:hypothetical protein
MAKTLTAQNIHSIDSISFVLDEKGKLKELNVTAEVNYGTFGMTKTVNILPHLKSPDEVGKAEALYKAIKRELERIYLG